MLVAPHKLIAKAFNMHYALGAFNAYNLEGVQAIISAAEELKSPVIVQASEGAIEYAGIMELAAIVKSLAERLVVPIVLHLDHGKSLEMAQDSIEAGFTSVMIDASLKDFQENIRITKEVVEYAHDRGVWVEAEIGTMLGAEGALKLKGAPAPEQMLTEPKEARRFAEETGVDVLAVAVGTIHGAFTGQEYIRFELLKRIENLLPEMPLVIHGASGLAPEQLKEASATNVCKVNVDTELRIAFMRAANAYVSEKHDKVDPREMLGRAREAVREEVKAKIRLLGSEGKAE